MFTSWPHRYALNVRDGETTHVIQAEIQGPNGSEPGVAIRTGSYVKYVLRADHALALCNEIVDALENHPNRNTTQETTEQDAA
jgi:hypothetical protein